MTIGLDLIHIHAVHHFAKQPNRQAGDPYKTRLALSLNLAQSRDGFINYRIDISELHVMHLDKVEILHVQPLQTFLDTFRVTRRAPKIKVFDLTPIARHFGCKVILFARNLLQRLFQHGLSRRRAI